MSSDATTLEDALFAKGLQLKRWFGAADVADDAVQNVAEKLITTGDRPGSGYLKVMLRNAAIDRTRAESRRRSYEEAYADTIGSIDERSPERALLADRALEALTAALDELAPTNRRIFLLAYVEEMPRAEIARSLGLKLRTVEKRLAKARVHCFDAVREYLV